MSSTGEVVDVICGINTRQFQLGGRSVAQVKKILRDSFNIPYFAYAYVNGSVVDLSVIVSGGDTLVFHQSFGFKGSGQEPWRPEELIAGGLHRDSPELQAISRQVKELGLSTEESIDRTIELVRQHFIRYFGPVGVGEQPVVSALARMIVVQEERLHRLETRVFEQTTPHAVSKPTTPPQVTTAPLPNQSDGGVTEIDDADEIGSVHQKELRDLRRSRDKPIADRTAFRLLWKERAYTMKNTKEFHLLAVLAGRFESWVSLRELRAEIWPDFRIETNSIQKTVSNLRKKLKELGLADDLKIDGSNRDYYMLKRA